MVELFSPYGTVIDAKVLTDPVTQVPRGVGFIRFATHAEAQRAIDALHNTTPPPLTKPLQVKVAESFHGPLRQTVCLIFSPPLCFRQAGQEADFIIQQHCCMLFVAALDDERRHLPARQPGR